MQAWVPNEALRLNFAGWTLSVEMVFYAAFPLVYVLFNRMRWNARLTWTTSIWFISNSITAYFAIRFAPDPEQANVFIKFFPLLHLNSFLIGIVAGMWYQEAKQKIRPLLLYSSCLFFLVYPLLVPPDLNALAHNGLFAPMFAVLIVAIAQAKQKIAQLFSIAPMVVGGDISYGIYILQVPVYNWVYRVYDAFGISTALHEEGRFFLYLLVLCIASWVSLVTVEQWGKRFIRGILGTAM